MSAPMVRAILAGTKTQTRRIVKCPAGTSEWVVNPERDGKWWPTDGDDYVGDGISCPYGAPGDRLWVRETWYCDDFTANDFAAARSGYVGKPPSDERIIEQWRRAMDYRADHDCHTYEAGCPCSDDDGRSCWRPSIFMPRWASRITLEITGVRVERLHAITEDDARAEGVDGPHWGRWTDLEGRLTPPESAPARPWARSFFVAWSEINGRDSLWANPWVWVIEFRRIEAQERAA